MHVFLFILPFFWNVSNIKKKTNDVIWYEWNIIFDKIHGSYRGWGRKRKNDISENKSNRVVDWIFQHIIWFKSNLNQSTLELPFSYKKMHVIKHCVHFIWITIYLGWLRRHQLTLPTNLCNDSNDNEQCKLGSNGSSCLIQSSHRRLFVCQPWLPCWEINVKKCAGCTLHYLLNNHGVWG